MAIQKVGDVQFVRNPKLNQIEARFSRYAQSIFKKHTHDTYSIAIVEQGKNSFFYQGTTYVIEAGVIALINPGAVHMCNPVTNHPWAYRMFYIEPALIRDIAQEIFEAPNGLPHFPDPIIRDTELFQEILQLYAVLSETDMTLEKESSIHETLSKLLARYSDYDTYSRPPLDTSGPLQRAHTYVMEKLACNISLHELSSVAGLSPYHLLRLFRQQFGLPPHTFQVQQRINLAKKLLAEGQAIIDVALDTGFSDQSHFSNKFKTLVGATPRQYQLTWR